MDSEETRKMVETAINGLAEALEQGQSETLRAYLAAMGRFWKYSLGNAMLIALQRPHATRVAGFHTWKKLGRSVRKGERGIAILAPLVRRPRKERDHGAADVTAAEPAAADPGIEGRIRGEDVQNASETVVGFRTAYVFDVSQTDGAELPAFAVVQGEARDLLERLHAFAAQRGVSIRHAPHLGGAEGLSAGGTIVLRSGMAPAEEFSVLAHELAHEALHHDGVNRPKAVRETEAEAVAHAVCSAVGLDVNTASSDYLQLYDGTKETLMGSMERIRSLAVEIIAAVMRQDGCVRDRVLSEPSSAPAAA